MISGEPSADEIDEQKLQEAMRKLQALNAGKMNTYMVTEKDLKKIAEEEFIAQREITEAQAKEIESAGEGAKEKVVREKDGKIYAEKDIHIDTKPLEGLLGKEMKTDDMTAALQKAGYNEWQVDAIEARSLKNDPRKGIQMGTLKNFATDWSKDGIISKAPTVGITAAQIALMVITGSLIPPLLPALGLGAIGLACGQLTKGANKRVMQNAQADALAKAAGIEPKYARHIVDMQEKEKTQLKQLNKFTTKAMKNDEMDKWVTDTLKDANNEQALEKLEDGKNVDESFKQMLARRLMGLYQPESAQARAIFLEMLLRGVLVEDEKVMEFVNSQPKKRKDAVMSQADHLKQTLVAQRQAEQAALAQAQQTPEQALNEEQQLAVLSSFTDAFTADPKMKEFSKNVVFKDNPDAFNTLYSERTDDQAKQLKMQYSLAALAKGLVDGNADAVGFTQSINQRFSPAAMKFLDGIVTATAANMVQQPAVQAEEPVAETAETQEVSTGLSEQEKLQTLRNFSSDFLADPKLKEYTQNEVYERAPQVGADLYNPQVPLDLKIDYVMTAFTMGLMDENPDAAAFNDRVTPKYEGDKEEFLSEVITNKAEEIEQMRGAAQAQ